MKLQTISIFVDDQQRALDFYTGTLEPEGHPAVAPFTDAVGVTFTQPPTDVGPVVVAVLDDTCGNLLQPTQRTG